MVSVLRNSSEEMLHSNGLFLPRVSAEDFTEFKRAPDRHHEGEIPYGLSLVVQVRLRVPRDKCQDGPFV